MKKLPGRRFLKIISIIFIVLSTINFWGIASVAFTFSLELAATLYAFLLGVMGIIYHNNGEQAGMLKWLAIVNIGFLAVISVVAFVAGRVGGALMVLAIEVPITALYLIGAIKNVNAVKQGDQSAETVPQSDKEK